MLDSINGLSDKEITEIIDENLFEQIRYYNKSPGSILVENDSIIKFTTEIPLPFFNCVLYYNFDKDSLLKQLKSFKEYGKSRKTSLLWLKGPSSNPRDIEPILSGEDFKYDDRMTGMAVDINKINPSQKDIPGFRIEVVENSRQLNGWIFACLKGFNENGKNFQNIYDFEESLGMEKTLPWVRFTGIVDDEPVATSAVFLGSKAAGLDNVTTIPMWRKKGVGALMVKKALRFSESRGYKVGVLQASDMGLGLYRRLGFRKFAVSKEYIWKNSDVPK
jgi:ribosomal protein S18 acetylase RimI-like enzyme